MPSTDVIQLALTLKMTIAQVVETSVTVNNNSPIQYYVHPDDQTQPRDERNLFTAHLTAYKTKLIILTTFLVRGCLHDTGARASSLRFLLMALYLFT